MIFLCLIFKFSLLQQLSSLALFYFLNLYTFMLSSNQCFLSIRDSCLDQRGALLHFVYFVLCLVFCTSILQSSWEIPQAARIRSSGPHVRSFCVRYFCVSVLFPAQFALARFLYFVHFIRVPFNNCLHPSIYLFGPFSLSVRWTCLSFSTIVSYWTKIIKYFLHGHLQTHLEVESESNGLMSHPKIFYRFPASLLVSVEFHPLNCTFFQHFFWVFHSPES